jgi:hypothetical protein
MNILLVFQIRARRLELLFGRRFVFMRVMKPTGCTIYLQFIQSLHLYIFSGLLLAHYHEVTMYICNNWYVLCVLVG